MSFESSLVWVDPGFLCFGERPGLWRSHDEDLAHLRQLGVQAMISLLDEKHLIPTYLQSGFTAAAIPLADFQAPSLQQIAVCMRMLQDLHSAGTPAYIHCYAGRGRAGTMAAAWLISRGMGAQDAIERLRRIKAGTVETDAQYNALLEYAATLTGTPKS